MTSNRPCRSQHSTPTSRTHETPSRYPLEPLADALGVKLGVPGRRNEAPDISHGRRALCEFLGLKMGQLRYRESLGGLDVWEADEAACKLDKHASEIWPEWGDELLDALDDEEWSAGWSA